MPKRRGTMIGREESRERRTESREKGHGAEEMRWKAGDCRERCQGPAAKKADAIVLENYSVI